MIPVPLTLLRKYFLLSFKNDKLNINCFLFTYFNILL